mmetsp:Transcript_34641/g.73772  ORF Transcript_34641/g.73772 Transcript_34641/m.73772 type:complete len:482 (+) Transcript_34641:354-1799(+)
MRHHRSRTDSLSPSRSRSPRAQALLPPPLEVREAFISDFAALFWLRNKSIEDPPWCGEREARIRQFRERLVGLAEQAAPANEDWIDELLARPHRATIDKVLLSRWQRFTFFDDLARLSDVLFRGPIDGRHAHEVDVRLLAAWQRLDSASLVFAAGPMHLNPKIRDYHISAVRIAVMLETERPLEEEEDIPDARTLATLLNLRCEKEGEEEVLEMYKVLCHKLTDCLCPGCSNPFDDVSSLGHFENPNSGPVPKVLVPQCGHAMHSICFCSQLASDRAVGHRGCCRYCGLEYAWTTADVDPMIDAFCLVFGPHVDLKVREMAKERIWSEETILGFVQACERFSAESNGLLGPATIWRVFMRRYRFSQEDTIIVVSEEVLARLDPAADPPTADRTVILWGTGVAVVDAEDESDTESGTSAPTEREAKNDRTKVTNIFLASSELDPDPEPSPSCEAASNAADTASDSDDAWESLLPPPPLVEDI